MANSIEDSIDPLEYCSEWRLPLSPEALIRLKVDIWEIHKKLLTESRTLEWEDVVRARMQARDNVFDVVASALLDCNALEESMLTWQVPDGPWEIGSSRPLPIPAIVELVAESGGWRFMGNHLEHPSDYRSWKPEMCTRFWRDKLAKQSICAERIEAAVAPNVLPTPAGPLEFPEPEDSLDSTVNSLLRRKPGRRRIPDLRSSRERLGLVSALARELATIKPELKRFCTPESLKKRHPEFMLWAHIDELELQELVDGAEFTPKAFAESLTLRKYGITSRETLKKDRKKILNAPKADLFR